MKKAFLLLIFIGFGFSTGCHEILNDFPPNTIQNSGIISEQEVNLTNFSRIDIYSGFELFLTQGSSESISIVADQNVLPHIEYFQKGDKITFQMEKGYRTKQRSVKIYILAKNISELSGGGGSSLIAESLLQGEKIKLSLSGGSVFTGKIDYKELQVSQSGGSTSKISGNAVNLNANLSGGSQLIGPECCIEYLDLNFSGGSSADLIVTGEIFVQGSGGSQLTCSGGGRVVRSSFSGGSGIRYKN